MIKLIPFSQSEEGTEMAAIYYITIAATVLPALCILSDIILRIDILWIGEDYL